MKIKLKLGVSDQSKSISVEPDELGYTEEDWEDFDDETKHRLLVAYVDAISDQPYWYLESFKTL